jgi:hypothetical protein
MNLPAGGSTWAACLFKTTRPSLLEPNTFGGPIVLPERDRPERTSGLGLFGLIGLGAYAAWERVSDHPMTPPRLAQNRDLLALNVATFFVYAGTFNHVLSGPLDLVDRRGLMPAGWRSCRPRSEPTRSERGPY